MELELYLKKLGHGKGWVPQEIQFVQSAFRWFIWKRLFVSVFIQGNAFTGIPVAKQWDEKKAWEWVVRHPSLYIFIIMYWICSKICKQMDGFCLKSKWLCSFSLCLGYYVILSLFVLKYLVIYYYLIYTLLICKKKSKFGNGNLN